MSLQEQLNHERHIINGAGQDRDGWAAWAIHARTALPQRNAQLQALLDLAREESAQGHNAVSLERLTRAIEEATQ